MSEIKFKLQLGERFSGAKEPVISFIPNGSKTYLWVGDDSPEGGSGCFGTLSGTERLRSFASKLLGCIGPKSKRKSK